MIFSILLLSCNKEEESINIKGNWMGNIYNNSTVIGTWSAEVNYNLSYTGNITIGDVSNNWYGKIDNDGSMRVIAKINDSFMDFSGLFTEDTAAGVWEMNGDTGIWNGTKEMSD